MTKVFISYSRKDTEFARQLADELKKNKLEFWVDWEGIPPTVDWMKQVQKGIEGSDVFLFLLSPDSAKSKICGEELIHAVKNGKRLIPLVVRDVKPEEVFQELSHLNWTFFRKKDNFEESFQKLLLGINTDFEWVEVHSRLLVRALEWNEAGKDPSFLLRGKDLSVAETQLAINTSKNPHPTDLHREYILESRQAADRQRRWFTVSVVVAAIVMFALAVYGFREAARANENEQREIIAKNHAQAKEFESKINQLSALAVTKIDQNFNQALLLGVEAYRHAEENAVNNYSSQDAISAILQSNPGLIHVLTGHTDWVNVMAISPDGDFLASGSYDNTVILWNISNPAFPVKLKTLTEHTASVDGVAFSSDGKTLASRSGGQLILWDISDPSDPELLSETSGTWSSNLVFTQDDQTLLTVNNSLVVLLNITNRRSPVELTSLQTGEENASVVNIAFNPDKNLLFSLLYDGNIIEWDITDPANPIQLFLMQGNISPNSDSIYSNVIAISPDGRTLAHSNSDTTIALWDITDPASPAKLSFWGGHSLPVTSLSFSLEGDILVTSSGDAAAPIILWDISNRNVPKKIRTLAGHSLTVTSVTFNQNNGILISGSRDGTLMLWNMNNPKTPIELGHIDNIYNSFAFKPNSNLLASTGSEGTLAIWDISSPAIPKQIKNLNEAYVLVDFSPDGKLLASSDTGGNVILWDTEDYVKLKTLKANDEYTNLITFSADGKIMATAGDKFILWDINDPKKPVSLSGDLAQPDQTITDIVFSSDGKFMASTIDKTIVLWDVSNPAKPAKLSSMEGHSNSVVDIAFSPTNYLLASASKDKTIIFWDLTDPVNPQSVSTLSNHSDWVESIAFSPDGTMLASGSDDKQINVWNISNPASPVLIGELTGHKDIIVDVSFNPIGNFIASWSYDYRIIFWDINPESWVQKACSVSGGDLTIIEWKQFFPAEEYRATCEPFKTYPSTEETGEPIVPVIPTAEQPAFLLPVCQIEQTLSCDLPASQKLDEFCVDNISYGLYRLPINTTFEVVTPGFTCINEEVNSYGEPRISCTGPTNQNFEVSFCNSSCSNTLDTESNQCQVGYGLDSAQGCCTALSTTNNSCVTETLTLLGCK
ncbi:MAG: TIR domain-containing protein [Anaerolineales bacterium]|nr:TIR domain-containing protein [Anaerolineales bacterium]